MTECRRVPKKVVLLPRGDVLKVEHEDVEDHTRRFDDFEVKDADAVYDVYVDDVEKSRYRRIKVFASTLPSL